MIGTYLANTVLLIWSIIAQTISPQPTINPNIEGVKQEIVDQNYVNQELDTIPHGSIDEFADPCMSLGPVEEDSILELAVISIDKDMQQDPSHPGYVRFTDYKQFVPVATKDGLILGNLPQSGFNLGASIGSLTNLDSVRISADLDGKKIPVNVIDGKMYIHIPEFNDRNIHYLAINSEFPSGKHQEMVGLTRSLVGVDYEGMVQVCNISEGMDISIDIDETHISPKSKNFGVLGNGGILYNIRQNNLPVEQSWSVISEDGSDISHKFNGWGHVGKGVYRVTFTNTLTKESLLEGEMTLDYECRGAVTPDNISYTYTYYFIPKGPSWKIPSGKATLTFMSPGCWQDDVEYRLWMAYPGGEPSPTHSSPCKRGVIEEDGVMKEIMQCNTGPFYTPVQCPYRDLQLSVHIFGELHTRIKVLFDKEIRFVGPAY